MKCECGGALRFTHCITGHEVWSCAFCGRETLIEEDSGPMELTDEDFERLKNLPHDGLDLPDPEDDNL